MTTTHEFATRDALMSAAAARIADDLNQAILAHGNACLALSGGGTPEPAYRALGCLPVDWSKVTFALVDERFVTVESDASNEGMISRALAPALSQGAAILPLVTEWTRPSESAERAEALYAARRIDIAVMGMGEDGHTASWFPGMAQLSAVLDAANPRSVMSVFCADAPGSAERITLTRSAIARASAVMLLITGDAKRKRLEQALSQRDAPVAALFEPPVPQPDVWWSP
jgi:6-phosphogluconolactonase